MLASAKRCLHRSTGRSTPITRCLDTAAHSKKIIELASVEAKIGIWECDLKTEAITWTDGVYVLFDMPPGSPITRGQALALYDPASRAQMESLRARAIRERTSFTLDVRITTVLGQARWIRLTANVECESGKAVRLFGMKQDITQERILLERLQTLAETDPLTGLANVSRMRARLDESARNGTIGALLLIDLDGFKRVNDTLGHAAGNLCLVQSALRLREACTPQTLIARFGGDEFAIVTEAGTTLAEAEALAETLLAALRRPIERDGQPFQISGSIGIALPPASHQQDVSVLLGNADVALYAAKAAGRNRYRIFGLTLYAQPPAWLPGHGQLDLFCDPTAVGPSPLLAA